MRRFACILAATCALSLPAAEQNSTDPVLAAARAANLHYQLHLETLLAQVHSPDQATRLQAIYHLGYLQDSRAIAPLLMLLDPLKESEAIIIASTRALARLGASAAVPAISGLTTLTSSRPIQLAAIDSLGQLQALTERNRLNLVNDEEEGVRAAMITVLGAKEPQDAAEVGKQLAQALQFDESSHIRRMAAIGLGQLGNNEYAPLLVRALSDGNAGVRRRAAEALAKLGYRQAVPELLLALEGQLAAEPILRAIVVLTGQDFGYRVRGTAVERSLAIERAFTWWAANSKQG